MGIFFASSPGWWKHAVRAVVTCAALGNAATITYDPPAQNFTQKINHAANDNATFTQRYQMDTTHFKPGGPILFHQSEEGNMSNIQTHVFMDYAPKLGAIVATLEHRYFGDSFPYNLTGASDIASNLKEYGPLTLENVLQDAVEFTNFIRLTVSGAENSKAIFSGGSYGGFLAILARVHHPDTFHGSFAMSPAARGLGAAISLEDNPLKFAATDMVANMYWDADAGAASKIRDALSDLETCIKDNSTCVTIAKDLGLCTRPSNATEWASVQFQIHNQLWAIPQFDYGRAQLYPADSLALLVNQTLSASSSGQILRRAALMGQLTANDTTCFDWAGADTTSLIGQFSIGMAFLYINCQYFITSEWAVAPDNTLFPPTPPDLDTGTLACAFAGQDWVTPDLHKSAAFWEEKLNITDAVLDKVTRLVITHGSFDRTAAIGTPTLSRTTSNRNQSRVITVTGMGHVENIYSEALLKRGVRPQVDELRDAQLAYIQEWLGTGGADTTSGEKGGSGTASGSGAGSTSASMAPVTALRYKLAASLLGCLMVSLGLVI